MQYFINIVEISRFYFFGFFDLFGCLTRRRKLTEKFSQEVCLPAGASAQARAFSLPAAQS
jgi:hypothetical protein